jgi:hypothetical protein
MLYDHRDSLAYPPLILLVAAEGLDLGIPHTEPLFEEGSLLCLEELLERAETELKRSLYSSTVISHALSLCQTLLLLSYRKLNAAQIE